jgi:acetolactate synthase-1/2/3 large subunit
MIKLNFSLSLPKYTKNILKISRKYSFLYRYKHTNLHISKNNTYNGMTGGQIIYNKLQENKVDNVFMYTGGAVMPLIDAFNVGKINYYINTHEQSLGHSATGYSKSTGKPGVCIVTSGPGLTNLVTPITDANNDSTPLIILSGQVSKSVMGSAAFQECPSTDITKSITKWNYCLDNIEELPMIMDYAFKIATSGIPGVVHLDLPKCITSSIYQEIQKSIFESKMDFTSVTADVKQRKFYMEKFLNNCDNTITPEDTTKLKYVSKLIKTAKSPIIIVGKGCLSATEQLRKIVKITNIPVTSTIFGMGILPENDPLSLEFLGMHGNVAANYAIQDSDLIINLGSRFDDRTTGNTKFYGKRAMEANLSTGNGGIVHVNLDKSEICKNINSHYNFNIDCETFLDSLLPLVSDVNSYNNTTKDRIDWLNKIKEWKIKHPFNTNNPRNNTINTQMVVQKLGEWLNTPEKNDKPYFISTGVGNHQMMAAQFIKWNNPNTFVTSGSLGVMGVGLPYAIGAQIANPHHLVVDIDGDGSFNQTLAELKTVKNYNLPIKIAIMNDGELSMVKAWENLFFDSRYVATNLMENPDYGKLAESFGITSLTCSTEDELEITIDKFLNYKGPILCDFRVFSDLCLPLVKPGSAIDDMYLFGHKIKSNIDIADVPG